ncbi:MAG: radical SAM protein [Sulfolobales archaeon]
MGSMKINKELLHRGREEHYERLGDSRIKCLICERRCVIENMRRGICRNYVNIDGVLYHVGYGVISAVESRPIEIKPFFHYWPNSTALTFSGYGCNFYCPWCQNHFLSFSDPLHSSNKYSPEDLVKLALASGDEGLNASFNEPATLFDFLLDVFDLGRRKSLYGSIVTNGYFTLEAVKKLLEIGVNGWSIDIKGCPKMRRALASIDHSIIYRNARYILDNNGHVEMVYLVVTNTNDFEECYQWIIDQHLRYLGNETPLHINRYYPAHNWREPPTSISKLLKIAEEAKKSGIEYVYVGNIGDPVYESTKCPRCGKLLIGRIGFRVEYFNVSREGDTYRCPRCGYKINIKGRYIPKKTIFLPYL